MLPLRLHLCMCFSLLAASPLAALPGDRRTRQGRITSMHGSDPRRRDTEGRHSLRRCLRKLNDHRRRRKHTGGRCLCGSGSGRKGCSSKGEEFELREEGHESYSLRHIRQVVLPFNVGDSGQQIQFGAYHHIGSVKRRYHLWNSLFTLYTPRHGLVEFLLLLRNEASRILCCVHC